jgi:hypothetical protein
MYFHHFSFVYNHNGKARNFTDTHADHCTSWVYGVTGKKPQTKASGKESPPSQTDTFSEVLNLIRETQPESPTDKIVVRQKGIGHIARASGRRDEAC